MNLQHQHERAHELLLNLKDLGYTNDEELVKAIDYICNSLPKNALKKAFRIVKIQLKAAEINEANELYSDVPY